MLGAPALAAQAAAREGTLPYAWKSVPFGAGGFIDGFVFHPRERGLLYARTDIGGAYRFDVTSNAWVPLLDHLSRGDADLMGVLSLAVDPNDASRLYAACGLYLGPSFRDGAVLSSDNRGGTWKLTELGVKLGGNSPGRGSGERLQVDPRDGNTLLLGTSQDGLMKSTDGARSFTRLDFAPRHVSLVLFDPQSPSIYVGSHDQPGLYVSHDGGASFAREPGTPEQAPQRAVFGSDGSLYVSFATSNAKVAANPSHANAGSVCKRGTQGRWSDISPVKPSPGEAGFGFSGLDVDPQVPGRLVVSTIERWRPGDDIFLSTDDGASWTALGARSTHDSSRHPWLVNYMRGADRMGHWIADVKIDPFNGDRAIYGTGYGLWISRNLKTASAQSGLVNWDFTVANFEETATLQIASPPAGPRLLAAMGDVAGAAWDDVNRAPRTRLSIPTSQTNRSIDFASLRPKVIARTADQAPTRGYVSIDGGLRWRAFGPSAYASESTRHDGFQAGHVAVSARASALLWAPPRRAALYSHDLGRTWHASAGWPDAGDARLTPVADRTADRVFYVYDRRHGRILASTNGGQRFTPFINDLPVLDEHANAQLVCAPGKRSDLWLALPDGLLHINGERAAPQHLPTVARAWLVALGKRAPGAPYHSVYVWGVVAHEGQPIEGLFRSDDAGATFSRINDDRHRYGYLLSMAADAREHGVVYVAAHGRGVLVGRPERTR